MFVYVSLCVYACTHVCVSYNMVDSSLPDMGVSPDMISTLTNLLDSNKPLKVPTFECYM